MSQIIILVVALLTSVAIIIALLIKPSEPTLTRAEQCIKYYHDTLPGYENMSEVHGLVVDKCGALL